MRRLWMVLLAALSACGHIVVDKVGQDATTSNDGVIYALPKTVVQVNLKVDKTVASCPAFGRFAAIFVPGGKAACEKGKTQTETSYSIEDGPTIGTFGEPDPDNIFLVRYTGGGLIDQALTMSWNESGVITGASPSVTNRAIDVGLSGAKLAVGLGTKLALGGGALVAATKTCQFSTDNDAWITPILDPANTGDASPDLIDRYCSMSVESRGEFEQKEDAALLQEAAKFYGNRITPLLQERIQAMAGNRPVVDVAGLIGRIDDEISRLLTLKYVGARSTTTWNGSVDVRRLDVETDLNVLQIAKDGGICLGSDASIAKTGIPIPAKFKPRTCGGDLITLRLSYYPSKNSQLFSHVKDVANGERSFRYRLPAQVAAQLSKGAGNDREQLAASVFSIAQLGTVVSLPSTMRSRTLSYDLAFVESTGALKTFKLGAAGGLDASTLDALAGIGGTIADYRHSRQTAEDELTTLTRQDQLLKLRDDICAIQKKYGLECTTAPQ